MKVNVLEAKNNLSQLIRSAQAGEEVVIANRGQPVARLVAIDPAEGARTWTGPDFVAWLRDNPLPPHLQRSAEEIDAGIQAERESWD
ncbi:type II toxin-antitoxin system Phd/YefM family antitoxin [Pelomonas sp. KK5]|uniref:type II toxin-antitoxin system Phd/YefM family antitoxin n=1 Tax=Pelomonas sp. KK5 TaxID=1855730 RepID=UPI00097CB6AD|nr:type II toxin-antitoxin system prevent-host-death family antitoxin [Pelomonas sp. KK5]